MMRLYWAEFNKKNYTKYDNIDLPAVTWMRKVLDKLVLPLSLRTKKEKKRKKKIGLEFLPNDSNGNDCRKPHGSSTRTDVNHFPVCSLDCYCTIIQYYGIEGRLVIERVWLSNGGDSCSEEP